jgi:membrane protein
MGRVYRIAINAFEHFNESDGWAIASHIALSTLMALFPFLIVVTALGAVFGSKELADETTRILLEAWPKEVAGPIAREIHDVLTNLRPEVFTVGALFAIIFASSGVESLRIGLNRAYGVKESRSWWLLRLESIGYVLVGATALLVLSFLVLLWPLIWGAAIKYMRWLEPFDFVLTLMRLGAAAAVLIVALTVVHMWLPAGRRSLAEVAPGIVVTLVLWLACGALFGRYLAEFAFAYTIYYAGLASVIAALFFLYLVSLIFIYGGELNAAIRSMQEKKK